VLIKKTYPLFMFLPFMLKARSRFRVHSPFVFSLYSQVILNREQKEIFRDIEKIRSSLLKQKSLLETTDFGAGAGGDAYRTRFRTVRDVTRKSSVGPRTGRLLHNLAGFARPDHMLEIGTAMGISTMYMATAAPESHFVTMEGCAVIAEKARENFDGLQLSNVELKLGSFNGLLKKTLGEFPKLDMVFIDGNHQREATLEYWNGILPLLHENSIVVIDDIHWSPGMRAAWKRICANPEVSISIDLYNLGILLFRKDIATEHFVLRS